MLVSAKCQQRSQNKDTKHAQMPKVVLPFSGFPMEQHKYSVGLWPMGDS
jgi:hypothetical protein